MSILETTNTLLREISAFISAERKPTLCSFVVCKEELVKQFASENPNWENQLINQYKEECNKQGKRFLKGEWKSKKKLIAADVSMTATKASTAVVLRPLTEEQKANFRSQYQSMDPMKKWKIKNKCIEDIMYSIGCEMEYEHALHSWIFDPLDSVYDKYFNDEEIEELTEITLPSSAELSKALDDISSCSTLEELKETLSITSYDRTSQFDFWWMKRTIEELLLLFETNKIAKLVAEGSEKDLVCRVWALFDPLFEYNGFDCTRPEKPTVASESNTNTYSVSGTVRQRKYACSLPDLIVTKNGYEFACAEYGKEDKKDVNMKEVVEGAIKLPKELKNMLVRQLSRLQNNEEEKMKQVRTLGFLCSKLRMTLQVLDQPSGYVCRLLKFEEAKVPSSPDNFARDVTKVLEVVWQAKELMLRTEGVFTVTTRSISAIQRKRKGKELPPNVNNLKQYKHSI
ncbi:hypothetical protein EDC96DRAFT_491827 [Choanephora cucurbitarum]|nr:hypothetical protein EDC96DRAFT_491827 [Choanephora cucurbitarum]